jgi:biotin carboxyl carrier protein
MFVIPRRIEVGDAVKAGEVVVVFEAMKMQSTLTSSAASRDASTPST